MSISFLVIQTIRVLQLNAGPTAFEKIQINNEEEEKEPKMHFHICNSSVFYGSL